MLGTKWLTYFFRILIHNSLSLCLHSLQFRVSGYKYFLFYCNIYLFIHLLLITKHLVNFILYNILTTNSIRKLIGRLPSVMLMSICLPVRVVCVTVDDLPAFVQCRWELSSTARHVCRQGNGTSAQYRCRQNRRHSGAAPQGWKGLFCILWQFHISLALCCIIFTFACVLCCVSSFLCIGCTLLLKYSFWDICSVFLFV